MHVGKGRNKEVAGGRFAKIKNSKSTSSGDVKEQIGRVFRYEWWLGR